MNKCEKVSILVPFHNSHGTLVETINSVLAQDHANLEIIVADDHSDRVSRACLDAIARRHPMVHIIDVCGRGPSAARNAAVKAASGTVLCFLDADDCLRDGALSAYLEFLQQHPSVGVAFGRVRITPEPSKSGGVVTPFCASPSLAQIIGENWICTTSNIVVRAEAFSDIGEFDEELARAEDQEWLARAYANPNWSLAGIDRVTLDYRTSSGGLSSDLYRMEKGWQVMVETVLRRAQSVSDAQLSESTGRFYRYLARRALRLGQSRTACMVFLGRALAAYPRLLVCECRRTWATFFGAVVVLIFGVAPFRKIFR